MRDALGMNEHTKHCIEENIDRFCETVNQDIEHCAELGLFKFIKSFDITDIPKTLEGEPCIFIARDRLRKLGYAVIIKEADSVPHIYRMTVDWSDEEVNKNV